MKPDFGRTAFRKTRIRPIVPMRSKIWLAFWKRFMERQQGLEAIAKPMVFCLSLALVQTSAWHMLSFDGRARVQFRVPRDGN